MADDDDNDVNDENDDGFDPNAIIRLPGEPEPEPDARAIVDIRAQLGQAGPYDEFAYFNRTDTPVREGVFSFDVHQHQLQEALAAVGLAVRKGRFSCWVKCTIFSDRLRLQTFNQASFAEYFIPLVAASSSIPADRAQEFAVAFVIDYATLWRIVRRFPDVTMHFIHTVERLTLAFKPGTLRIHPYFTKISCCPVSL